MWQTQILWHTTLAMETDIFQQEMHLQMEKFSIAMLVCQSVSGFSKGVNLAINN